MPANAVSNVVNLLDYRTERERRRLPLFDNQDTTTGLVTPAPLTFRPATDRLTAHRRRMLLYMKSVAKG